MSEHVVSEGGGDPAIKLFGTTIAVPFLESQTTLVELRNSRSRSFDSLPPHAEEYFLKGGTDQERDISAVAGRSTLCGSAKRSQVLAYQLMERCADDQAMGSNKTAKVDASIVPVKKKKRQLSAQRTVDHQEKACHRSVKVVACPRCDSFDTKFCYFNNYNVNQPRHFCKHCQRYWTAGGTLRNVPIGAGRRKNKSGLTMMQSHPVVESEAVRGDPREAAFSSSSLYAIRMQQNSTSNLYLCQGKTVEIDPKIWAKTLCRDEATRGKHIYQDDHLLQLRSCTDSPAEVGNLVSKFHCSETTTSHSHPPEGERYRTYGCTAPRSFSEAWHDGHTTGSHTDISTPLWRGIFDPASAELNMVSTSGVQGQKDSRTLESKCPCPLDTLNWVNLWWVPEGPADNASESCSVASSILGKHGQDGRHRERTGKCAATTLRVHDYAFGCQPSMGSSPVMVHGLKTVKAGPSGLVYKTGTIEAVHSRHVNPAAMRRSMVFQEFNQM